MTRLNLDALLEAQGRSAYWLAKQTGLHQSVVSKLRHNQMKAIRLDVIDRICEALECQPGELIVREPARLAKQKSKA